MLLAMYGGFGRFVVLDFGVWTTAYEFSRQGKELSNPQYIGSPCLYNIVRTTEELLKRPGASLR